jgi:transcriptional regulator with XRE-family HTH domain
MDIKPIQIWERLDNEAKKSKKALNQAAQSTGISSGTISDWRNSFPVVDKLASVAEFYDISLDFIVFGKQNKINLSAKEEDLIKCLRQLDSRDQDDVLGNVEMKLKKAKKGDIMPNTASA